MPARSKKKHEFVVVYYVLRIDTIHLTTPNVNFITMLGTLLVTETTVPTHVLLNMEPSFSKYEEIT